MRRRSRRALALELAFCLVLPLVGAVYGQGTSEAMTYDPSLDFAQVTFVDVVFTEVGTARVSVTIRHDDEGWDHYADAWQLVDPTTDEIFAERVLLHPHVTEQPFTRSLTDVEVPQHLDRMRVRARCNVHGFGGREVLVDLTVAEGPGFTNQR